jgi:hypothetical protein
MYKRGHRPLKPLWGKTKSFLNSEGVYKLDFFIFDKKTSKIVSSVYAVLSNKPINKEFSGASYETQFKLQSWFTNWGENKIIKVYGCSFAYLENKNKEPVLSSKYSTQFISVYSNIAKDDIVLMNLVYIMENGLLG